MKRPLKIAIVQHRPIHQNLKASLEKAVDYIEAAAGEGAQLIVFGETWLAGYPVWLDFCPKVALWDHAPTKKVYARMYANSVEVGGLATTVLAETAKKHHISLVMGINEKGGTGTLYNSLLTFGPDGTLLNHHRKLMPTFTERLVHTTGDGNGLKAVDLPWGRMGGLICWEHWMPHARQALHLEGEEVHIAVWPNVHELLQMGSRSYAFEGRCFVVAAGQMMKVKDVPEELELPKELVKKSNGYLLRGGSCIVGPDGKYVLEPVLDSEIILYQTIDLNRVYEEKLALDVAGHYNRPDIFTFDVNRERKA